MPRYLPSLSTLISPENLPESLGFIQDAVDTIFDDVYFDHYQVISSKHREEKTYALDIIIDKRLGIDIPGTGLALLVNPPNQAGVQGETSFNISIYYRIGILRFINNFNLSQFSFQKEDMINLFLKICGIDLDDLLGTISVRIKNSGGTSLGFIIYTKEELVDFFNAYYDLTGTAHELVYTNNTTFESIQTGLASAGITTDDMIEDFDISTDYPNGIDTIEDVYARLNMEKDTGALSIPELIDRLNEDYALTGTPDEIIYTENPETSYNDILAALSDANISLLNLIINYIIGEITSIGDIENALVDFFVEANTDSYGTEFYDLFKPVVSASINNLNLAMEFPRTMLKPIDPTTNEVYTDENIKSMLRFNVGRLGFSTYNGLEFEGENSFDFAKSEIGNTGMTLYFDQMKLDLSRTTNIPEAAAAGYPEDFVGVFVESAEIGLSDKWFKNQWNTVKLISC